MQSYSPAKFKKTQILADQPWSKVIIDEHCFEYHFTDSKAANAFLNQIQARQEAAELCLDALKVSEAKDRFPSTYYIFLTFDQNSKLFEKISYDSSPAIPSTTHYTSEIGFHKKQSLPMPYRVYQDKKNNTNKYYFLDITQINEILAPRFISVYLNEKKQSLIILRENIHTRFKATTFSMQLSNNYQYNPLPDYPEIPLSLFDSILIISNQIESANNILLTLFQEMKKFKIPLSDPLVTYAINFLNNNKDKPLKLDLATIKEMVENLSMYVSHLSRQFFSRMIDFLYEANGIDKDLDSATLLINNISLYLNTHLFKELLEVLTPQATNSLVQSKPQIFSDLVSELKDDTQVSKFMRINTLINYFSSSTISLLCLEIIPYIVQYGESLEIIKKIISQLDKSAQQKIMMIDLFEDASLNINGIQGLFQYLDDCMTKSIFKDVCGPLEKYPLDNAIQLFRLRMLNQIIKYSSPAEVNDLFKRHDQAILEVIQQEFYQKNTLALTINPDMAAFLYALIKSASESVFLKVLKALYSTYQLLFLDQRNFDNNTFISLIVKYQTHSGFRDLLTLIKNNSSYTKKFELLHFNIFIDLLQYQSSEVVKYTFEFFKSFEKELPANYFLMYGSDYLIQVFETCCLTQPLRHIEMFLSLLQQEPEAFILNFLQNQYLNMSKNALHYKIMDSSAEYKHPLLKKNAFWLEKITQEIEALKNKEDTELLDEEKEIVQLAKEEALAIKMLIKGKGIWTQLLDATINPQIRQPLRRPGKPTLAFKADLNPSPKLNKNLVLKINVSPDDKDDSKPIHCNIVRYREQDKKDVKYCFGTKTSATYISKHLTTSCIDEPDQVTIGIFLNLKECIIKAMFIMNAVTFNREWLNSYLPPVFAYLQRMKNILEFDFNQFKERINQRPYSLNEILVQICIEAIKGIAISHNNIETRRIAKDRQLTFQKKTGRVLPIMLYNPVTQSISSTLCDQKIDSISSSIHTEINTKGSIDLSWLLAFIYQPLEENARQKLAQIYLLIEMMLNTSQYSGFRLSKETGIYLRSLKKSFDEDKSINAKQLPALTEKQKNNLYTYTVTRVAQRYLSTECKENEKKQVVTLLTLVNQPTKAAEYVEKMIRPNRKLFGFFAPYHVKVSPIPQVLSSAVTLQYAGEKRKRSKE